MSARCRLRSVRLTKLPGRVRHARFLVHRMPTRGRYLVGIRMVCDTTLVVIHVLTSVVGGQLIRMGGERMQRRVIGSLRCHGACVGLLIANSVRVVDIAGLRVRMRRIVSVFIAVEPRVGLQAALIRSFSVRGVSVSGREVHSVSARGDKVVMSAKLNIGPLKYRYCVFKRWRFAETLTLIQGSVVLIGTSRILGLWCFLAEIVVVVRVVTLEVVFVVLMVIGILVCVLGGLSVFIRP